VKWAGWIRTKIKDPAKIDKVIHTYFLCRFLASERVTSQFVSNAIARCLEMTEQARGHRLVGKAQHSASVIRATASFMAGLYI